MNPGFSTTLSSISTVVASGAVIIALILSYYELKEVVRSRSLGAVLEIFQRMTSEDMSVSRRYILANELPAPGKVPDAEYEQMHKVWVSFDNLGLLVEHNMLPKRIALQMFHDSAIKCWQKLEPHIRYEEYIRGTRYQIYFKDFYLASCQYSAKLSEQKEANLKRAFQRNQIGNARTMGLELRGIYKTLGFEDHSIVIQNQLDKLKQTVFLDRDGTLNVDDYVTYKEEQFQLLAGVRQGLLLLKTWGFDLVIVSNQSGIGRADYSEEDMHRFNDLLIQALSPAIIKRDDFYFCPHNPDMEDCDCYKPNPGMLLNAAKDKSINLAQSYMIGDKMSDILAGKRAGCKKTILVRTGITDDAKKYDVVPDYIVDDLLEAAKLIAKVEHIE